MTATPHKPKGSRIFGLERHFVVLAMAVMGLAVFFDVLHRAASRDYSWGGRLLIALVSFGLVLGALRMRKAPSTPRTWAVAALVVAVGYGAIRLMLWALPNGFVGAQTVGLVLMLWVGTIGASMAAFERRHLALDIGSKLWPRKALPYVQGVGNLITGLFCLALGLLSLWSIKDHWQDYVDTDGAGGVFSYPPIPKWAAYAPVPLAFFVMGVRFLLQMVEGIRKRAVEEEDALYMLGLGHSEASPSEER